MIVCTVTYLQNLSESASDSLMEQLASHELRNTLAQMLEIWKDVALSMSDPTNNPVCKDYYAIKVSSRVNVDQALHPWLKF